jgi:hypothetical protein
MGKYGTEMGGTRSMHFEEMRKNISWKTEKCHRIKRNAYKI